MRNEKFIKKIKFYRRQFRMLKAIEILHDEVEILLKENEHDNAEIVFEISDNVINYYFDILKKQ